MTELSDEDSKLVVLARGAMARAEADAGAAVRDSDGRTYAGAPVRLTALSLTGLQVAVATAVSSGAGGLEAAVLVAGDTDDPGLAAVAEIGGATVWFTDRSGHVTVQTPGPPTGSAPARHEPLNATDQVSR